jgi:hypothetical protein
MHATLGLTFLDPMAGIIAASIATPALLLLYFLRLRRRPLRISSTLLWERAAQDLQVNAPFQWIRPSWLLVLQLLILACLCLAVARPTIDRPTTQSDRLAIVVDVSASMRAADAGASPGAQTRFDAARDRARELVRRLPGSTEVMVIASAADAVTVAPFTRDRGMLRGAIDALDATDQPGNLGAALALVAAASTQTASEDTQPEALRAVVLTDAGYASAESVPSAGRATVELVRVGPEPGGPRDNVGILSLAAKRDYDDPTIVRLFLRVASWREAPTTAAIRVDLDGVEQSLQTVEVPARTAEGPGDASTTIAVVAPTASLVSATITQGDLLEADNTAALRLGEASGPRVMIVQPEAPAYDADYALIEAVRTLDIAGLTVMTGGEFDALAPDAPEFRDHDLVVLDRVVPARLPPIPSISFDATVPIPGLTVTDAETPTADGFAFWNRSHPVLRYTQLGDVKINAPKVLTTPESGVRTDAGVIRTDVVATGANGPLMVVVDQGATRRVVVAFSLRRTRWWTEASFPIFMANVVDFLAASGRAGAGEALRTTDPITLTASPGAEAVIEGPNRFERRATASSEGVARFGAIPNVGVFTARIAGAPAGALATNLLDAQESALETHDDILVNGQEVRAGSLDAVAPREIREWFVALAIVLLALEWALFAWKMRV